jgi:hypothetical protein
MTATEKSTDIEHAIQVLVREQFAHGARQDHVEVLVKQLKQTAGIENETTDKAPD